MQLRLGRFVTSLAEGLANRTGFLGYFHLVMPFAIQRKKTKTLPFPPPPFASSQKKHLLLKIQLMKGKIITNALHFSGGGTV